MAELATKAGKEASAGAANFGARAGSAIRGNLFRGTTGQFQGGPAAQVASRLKQIRARKAGAGKKPAKPKTTPEQQRAAKQQAKDAARGKTLAGLGIDAGGQAALTGLAAGTQPDAAAVERGGFLAAGLVEKAEDGSYRMTAAGRGLIRAAESGDAGRAGDVISGARDKLGTRQAKQSAAQQKKQQRAAQAKQKVKAKAATKKPARGTSKQPAPKASAPTPAEKAKNRKDALAKMQEKPNDESLAVLDTLMQGGKADPDFAQSLADETGLVEQAPDGSYAITAEGQNLLAALDKGDAKGAASALADGQAKVSQPPPKKRQTTTKGLDMADYDAILDSLSTHGDSLAELIDEDGAIKAGARHSAGDNKLVQSIYDAAEDIQELAIALGATPIDEADEEPDEADAETGDEMKAIPADPSADDIEMVYGSEIKALTDGAIGGYAVLFGTADTPDMSDKRDYFTKSTEYWLDRFGWPRPMTYHHGIDADTASNPIVGSWTKAEVRDTGIWLEGQLDRAHRYHGAIKELIKRGYLKLSSDSAPQWVVREKQPNGANEVKRWPLITASPTVTPAEPRLSGISFKALCAELGMNDTDDLEANDTANRERQDAAKAIEVRKRRLLLLQQQYELETTL